MTVVQVKVLIDGRVQGVNFRWYTQRKATELGLSGWVRNLSDGRVEAVFEGEEAAVNEALEWCQVGPPHARVHTVAVRYEKPQGRFTGFNVRY
ncbi:MAG: acylphosphatase [Anaerolineae bacterium]